MNASIAIVCFLVIGATAVLLIGIILHDMRMIRRHQEFARHPHARKWRWRPTLHLHATSGDISPEDLRQLKKSYRNLVLRDYPPDQTGIVLALATETRVQAQAIQAGLHYLADSPSRPIVELLPDPRTVRTYSHLLGNYRMILAAMFVKARTGLSITPPSSLFPVLIRVPTPRPKFALRLWNWLYRAVSFVCSLALPAAVTYALYLGVYLRQPELFFVYLAGFSACLGIAIWSYDGLSTPKKYAYVLGIPATYAYFWLLAWIRPLKMLANMAKAKVPIRVSLFARVKDM